MKIVVLVLPPLGIGQYPFQNGQQVRHDLLATLQRLIHQIEFGEPGPDVEVLSRLFDGVRIRS